MKKVAGTKQPAYSHKSAIKRFTFKLKMWWKLVEKADKQIR